MGQIDLTEGLGITPTFVVLRGCDLTDACINLQSKTEGPDQTCVPTGLCFRKRALASGQEDSCRKYMALKLVLAVEQVRETNPFCFLEPEHSVCSTHHLTQK